MAGNIISPDEEHGYQCFINSVGHALQCINRGSVGMPDNVGKLYKRYIIANYLSPLMKFQDYPEDNEIYSKEALDNIIKNILTNHNYQISKSISQNNIIDHQSNKIKQQETQLDGLNNTIKKQQEIINQLSNEIKQQKIHQNDEFNNIIKQSNEIIKQSNEIKQQKVQIDGLNNTIKKQQEQLLQIKKESIAPNLCENIDQQSFMLYLSEICKHKDKMIIELTQSISFLRELNDCEKSNLFTIINQLKNESIAQNNTIDQQSDQIKQQEEMINQLLIALDEKNKTVTQSIIGLFK